MNTVSQKVVERSHVRALDSDSGGSASTSKVFVKRFDNLTPFSNNAQWARMLEWCHDTLRAEHHDTTWWVFYPSFYFRDEREYTLFLLRWS